MSIIGTYNSYTPVESYDYTINSSGVKSALNTRTVNTLYKRETGAGSVTQGYRLKASLGTLPENQLMRSRINCNFGGRYDIVQQSAGTTMYLNVPGPTAYSFSFANEFVGKVLDVDSLELAPVYNAAVQNLQKSFSQVRANLPASAYEARKTCRMVTDTAKRIAVSITAIRRGKFLQAATALGMSKPPTRLSATVNGRRRRVKVNGNKLTDSNGKVLEGDIKFSSTDTSANWLAYRYGWIPLLSDVHGSLTTAYDYAQDPGRCSVTHRGKGRATLTSSAVVEYSIPSTVNYPRAFAHVSIFTEIECRLKVVATLNSKAKARDAKLGLSNPLSVAWEVLPYSFVADWFINVGEVLNGLTSYDGFAFVKGARMDTVANDLICTSAHFVRSGSWTILSSVATGKQHLNSVSSYKRVPIYDFPQVNLLFSINPFEGKVRRMGDAIALVHQLFKR